jgi:hypothetical protein
MQEQESEEAEMEMTIDEKSFDGEVEAIVPGETFVSFKYHGDSPTGFPINPSVSF